MAPGARSNMAENQTGPSTWTNWSGRFSGPVSTSFEPDTYADLSRDSLFAQQIAISFRVQVGDGTVDSGVEGVDIGKRLVGEIKGFEVMPDHFDVVELGRILGQPFDGEPMGSGRQCCRGGLADVNRAVVEDD